MARADDADREGVLEAPSGSAPWAGHPLRLPAYFFEAWGGVLAPAIQTTWLQLAAQVLALRAEGQNEGWHVACPLSVLARLIGVRSPATARSRILEPLRRDPAQALFLAEVTGTGRSEPVLTPALVVPLHPTDTPERAPPEAERALAPGISTEATPGGQGGVASVDPDLRELVAPVLVSIGEDPDALAIPQLRRPLESAAKALGRERLQAALERLRPHLTQASRPVAYLARALSRDVVETRPLHRSDPPTPSPPPERTARPLERDEIAAWCRDLRTRPAVFWARAALLRLEDADVPSQDEEAAEEMRRLATEVLQSGDSTPPTPRDASPRTETASHTD